MKIYKEERGNWITYRATPKYKVFDFLCGKSDRSILSMISEPIVGFLTIVLGILICMFGIGGILSLFDLEILFLGLSANVIEDVFCWGPLQTIPFVVIARFAIKTFFCNLDFGTFGSLALFGVVATLLLGVVQLFTNSYGTELTYLTLVTGACVAIKLIQTIIYHLVYGFISIKHDIERANVRRRNRHY